MRGPSLKKPESLFPPLPHTPLLNAFSPLTSPTKTLTSSSPHPFVSSACSFWNTSPTSSRAVISAEKWERRELDTYAKKVEKPSSYGGGVVEGEGGDGA